jgi:hypothetical protein
LKYCEAIKLEKAEFDDIFVYLVNLGFTCESSDEKELKYLTLPYNGLLLFYAREINLWWAFNMNNLSIENTDDPYFVKRLNVKTQYWVFRP